MIRNEVKLIGRLTANPELKYTKETNKALCNVVLAVNSIYSNEAEYLHLVFWNKTAISVTPKEELTKANQYRSLTLTTRNRKSIR